LDGHHAPCPGAFPLPGRVWTEGGDGGCTCCRVSAAPTGNRIVGRIDVPAAAPGHARI
jgi:hypothetical protein